MVEFFIGPTRICKSARVGVGIVLRSNAAYRTESYHAYRVLLADDLARPDLHTYLSQTLVR